MKKVICTAMLFASTAALATAQTTWNGLRFGMSVKDAQAAMASSKVTMFASDAQTLRSSNDFELRLGTGADSYPMWVELSFNKAGLSVVDLGLDVQELRRRKPNLNKVEATMFFSSDSYPAMHEKYGNPLELQGECDAFKTKDMSSWNGCSADWSVNGQAIAFSAFVVGSSAGAIIEYKPVSNAL